MKLAAEQVICLGQLLKTAREQPEALRRARKPKQYIDYSKSLVGQMKTDPHRAGIQHGLETGALGAVLGALATRLATKDPKAVVIGALLGGVVGGIPGYRAGKNQALSDYSRLLFLRRLGINRPGELETLQNNPELTTQITQPGIAI